MKKLTFTSNGKEWLLVDADETGKVVHPNCEYVEYGRLKSITEEKVIEVLGYIKEPYDVPANIEYNKLRLKLFLKSKGVHLFDNPLGEKPDFKFYNYGLGYADPKEKIRFDRNLSDWEESEQNTFYNPVLFQIL